MNQLLTVEHPRKREYSAQFKASVLEQCRQLGASLAGVALRHGINPNMVHRWMREDRQRLELIKLQSGALEFVPLHLPPSLLSPAVGSSLAKCEQPSADQAALAQCVRIEIERAGGKVKQCST
ncbi:MAG: transposase [Polaromonas sp.]|nr:transposase [Polaromonas sp.]